MCDIYTHADRVVVWLGPETHDSGLALSTLRSLGQEIRCDWHRQSGARTGGIRNGRILLYNLGMTMTIERLGPYIHCYYGLGTGDYGYGKRSA